jgi:preprotein translocase subunit SecA
MDYLQEGIQLRSYGQRDPLVEYQREGFTMFATMMDAIKEESVQLLFNLEVQVAVEPDAAPEAVEPVPANNAKPDAGGRASVSRRPVAAKSLAQEVAASADGAGHGVPHLVAPGLREARRPARLEYSAPNIDGDGALGHAGIGGGQAPATAGAPAGASGDEPLMYAGTPRNAKCPCGSGRAYKRCHGDPRGAI